MTNKEDEQRGITDAELEGDIRRGRKFTPQEAIGRLAGPGAMKGGSAISRQQQAENEIEVWLRAHIADDGGALKVVLNRHLKDSALLLENADNPLRAVATHCRQLLNSNFLLSEFVRQVDVEWSRAMDEKPHFEQEGHPPNPSDPYTIFSVRKALEQALMQLPF